MASQALAEADRRSITTAFRVLIRDVGGLVAAEHLLGYPASRLSEAASLNHPDRMPRVDHVAALEVETRRPLVTSHLAMMSGYTLLPVGAGRGPEGAALAAVLADAGTLGARAMEAMSDGKLDDAERAQLATQLGLLARGVAHAIAVLSAPTAGAAAGLRAVA